jgi:hypothetical protein
MSNSRWYAFKLWLARTVERLLPDMVRRQVLYTLEYRFYTHTTSKPGGLIEANHPWGITYEQLYHELRDTP